MNNFVQQLNTDQCRLYLPTFKSLTPFNTAVPEKKETLFIDLPADFNNIWSTPLKKESDLLQPLTELVTYLSQLIREGQQQVAVQQKEEAFDLVTEMDQGIEYLLRFWIKKHFPDHKIIGEEFGQDSLSPNDYCWYIDPIDGTSNYAKGRSHYCVNIGCVYQGKPFISLVAIPAENKILAANSVALQSDLSFKSAICSEFYSARLQDQAFFDQINDRLNKTIFRTMALGYSLSKMYEGHCDVFYKSNVKLWDIMAPAALLYFHQQDYWDIEIMTYEGDIFSPFSNEARYLHYLNERHQDNQRVGLFTVTKSSDPSSKQIIRECIYG